MKTSDVAVLDSPAVWEAFKSAGGPFVLFKFSPRCPVSFAAEEEYNAWLGGLPEKPLFRIARIDVVNQRELTRAIAAEVGVRHESPQVLWFGADGKVASHASHADITAEALGAEGTKRSMG